MMRTILTLLVVLLAYCAGVSFVVMRDWGGDL